MPIFVWLFSKNNKVNTSNGGSLSPIGLHLITMPLNQNKPNIMAGGKATFCGKNVGIIFYDKYVGERKKNKRKPKKVPDEQNLIASRKKTIHRMINLINCNAWQRPKKNGKMFPPVFLTLTFNENVKDLKKANRIFTKFMQNYNYELFKKKKRILQYVAVPEFQPESGRVHYHCLIFNLPYSNKNYDIARDVWGHGFIWMDAVYRGTPYSLSKYMTKYLTKGYNDLKIFNSKGYFSTKKLLKPIILKGYFMAKDVLEALKRTRPTYKIKNEKKEVDFIGVIDCNYAQLGDNENIDDLLPELDQYTRSVLQSEINKQQEKLKL